MDDHVEYGKALRLIRRRRKYLFSVILLYIPAMWLIHSVSPALRTMLTAFVIWVVLLMATCLVAAVCKCPRCGNYFHVHGMTMLFLRKCLHCQLHINADRKP
ncbi:MAG: hypothetical protein HXX11_11155 [Desulfuromonadales bacterium]|nr:hypothetical protein [Desulfuromonadales bacterium]